MGRARSAPGNDKAYKRLVGKPQEKRGIGRLMRRLEDNVKMDIDKRSVKMCT
jgi:hypothetical protein